MGSVFGDLYVVLLVVMFIYLTGRIQKAGVKSRSMSWIISAFIVFFMFFQYPLFAILGFFAMWGYYFFHGFSNGYANGNLMRHYMKAFRNPNANTQHLISPMGPNTAQDKDGWFGSKKG